VALGQQVQALNGHQAPVKAVAFSRDGAILASGGADAQVLVWDTASRRLASALTGAGGTVNGVAFSPNSQFVYAATELGQITRWPVPAP
jgi:WD40 repeat protein